METKARELKDEFTLDIAAPYLDGFEPPREAFNPDGNWEISYDIYSLMSVRGIGRSIGSLRLQRKALGKDSATLHLTCDKELTEGYRRRIVSEIHCATDSLSTPQRWTFSYETLDPESKPVENMTLEKSAIIKNGAIEIADGTRRRRISISGAYTLRWALFDAVQRLPREKFEPLRFTLLDHFDQPKPDQVLSFRKIADVILGEKTVQKERWEPLEKGRIRKTFWGIEGGQPVRLYAYEHLGPGIVPWVYWVDERGRLLFAIGGIEGYLLTCPKAS